MKADSNFTKNYKNMSKLLIYNFSLLKSINSSLKYKVNNCLHFVLENKKIVILLCFSGTLHN